MAFAQKPVATLPTGISGGPNGPFAGTVIDTTYALPTGGTTCAAHTTAQLTSCLTSTVPGDVIVLDAGVTYTGNWQLPQKSNPQTSGFT